MCCCDLAFQRLPDATRICHILLSSNASPNLFPSLESIVAPSVFSRDCDLTLSVSVNMADAALAHSVAPSPKETLSIILQCRGILQLFDDPVMMISGLLLVL
jgi:hypothetical protein